ncbi:TPA: phage major capsid protein, partial [Escherichia coli]
LKSDLEKELLELKRPAGGAQNKLATEHKEAFVGFLRKGREDGLRDLERKALQVGTDEDGGYAVPEELDRNILNLLKDEVVMRQEATVITVGGSDYKKLVNLGGTASGWVGETDTRSQTATSRLELIEPLMGEIYGNPQATQKMLDDAFFNVEAWINSELATEFAEQEEIAFTSGDGTKKPKGFLAYESTDETDKVRAFGKLQHIVSGEATAVTEMNDTSGRWSYARQLYGHVYTAKIGTLSELVTAGDQFNQQHITLAGYEKETQTPADELAASRTARAAVFIRNDPARPTQTGELVGMLPAPKGKRFTMTEQQTLLSHGVATAYVESGVLRIQRDVTTYRKNAYGVADNSYLDSETLHT